MTTSPHNWIRRCSTARLNDFLVKAEQSPSDDAGIHLTPDALNVVREEKDRRLADPNSSDFRPTFF